MAYTIKKNLTPEDLSRVQGWRECSDLIAAAVAQGWTYRPMKGGHLRMTPPDPKGVPVNVSGTPSDKHQRHQVLRLMRRSGLTWPWPPTPVKSNHPDAVAEIWELVPECSVAEVSNGGNVRRTLDHKPIKPDHKKIIVLTDDKGNVRSFSVPLLVRATFGHPPHPHVVPVPEAKKEADMVTAVETPITERWEPVLIEGVAEGYEVNALAKVLPPKNTKFKDRKPLVPTIRNGRMVVNLKMATKPGYRQFYLDEIVLEAFEARPSIKHYPKHCDNNVENCALDNLIWAEHDKTKSEAIKDHSDRLKEHVREIVDKAPPLTEEQRDKIGAIMGTTRKPPSGLVLADLALPPRTHGALKRKGIITVEGLLTKTERDLWDMGLTGLGIDAVKTKLASRGLSLASAEEEGDTMAEAIRDKREEIEEQLGRPVRHDAVAVDPPITKPEPEVAESAEPLIEDEPVQETPVVAVEPVVEEKDAARERWEAEQRAKGKVYPMGKLSEVVVKRVTTYTNPVTGLSVTVDESGHSTLPEGRLTAGQITALSHILMAITEDNDKLGGTE